jgi:hypothetical protein
MPHRTVDGGARVEVLRPGQAWVQRDGGMWLPDGTGSPVEEIA